MAAENKWGDVLASPAELELTLKHTALVIVDMQYLCAHRDYGIGARAKKLGTHVWDYEWDRVEKLVVPQIQKLQKVCRQRGVELIFIRVGSLTNDCRDVSPMYKRMKLFAPLGSKEAEILEELKPLENEAIITKGCSGAFNGSNIDQILTNIGIKNLIFTGVSTNYCVETTLRDAVDRGYNAILVKDACATLTSEQERMAWEILGDCWCHVMTADHVIELIEKAANNI